jgi:hypothetical protein
MEIPKTLEPERPLLERIEDPEEHARELLKLTELLLEHLPDVDLGGGNTLRSRTSLLLGYTAGRISSLADETGLLR